MSTTDRARKHAPKIYPKLKYLQEKVVYYSNSSATFNVEIIRVGDVELNPGDIKNPCSVCGNPVARTHRALACSTCKLKSHINCSSITPAVYYEFSARLNYVWECPSCLWKTAIGSMPFYGVDDAEFLQTIQCRNQIVDNNDDCLQDIVHKLATITKHLKIAHLNIRGVRNNFTKALSFWCIRSYRNTLKKRNRPRRNRNFIRRDRPDRQGGGCVLYYRKSMKVIHRLDLEEDKVEGICVQVKAGSNDTLLGII